MVERSELVEVGRARPSGVFETLSELAAVDVALHLDDDDTAGFIEREHVRATATSEASLSCDRKQALAEERLQVAPDEILDRALVEGRTKQDLPEGDEPPV